MTATTPTSRHVPLALSHVTLGALLALLVFVGLPARYLPVDAPAVLLVVLSVTSAVGLLLRRAWALALSRVTSGSFLLLGALTIALLATSLTYLATLYGPVGAGGALLMGGLAALLLPYMIGVPALQLWWTRRAH